MAEHAEVACAARQADGVPVLKEGDGEFSRGFDQVLEAAGVDAPVRREVFAEAAFGLRHPLRVEHDDLGKTHEDAAMAEVLDERVDLGLADVKPLGSESGRGVS